MKKLLMLSLLCLPLFSICQNTTEDLLRAKTIKDYLYIRPDFSAKKVAYQIDKIRENPYNKTFQNQLVVTVRQRDEEFNIISEFFNPFNYEIQLSDTSYIDANYAAMTKSMDAVASMISVLSNKSEGVSSVNIGSIASTPFIGNLKNPLLSGWKFLFNRNDINQCQPNFDYFIATLASLDRNFYDDGSGNFENQVKDGLTPVIGATTLVDLTGKLPAFKDMVARVKTIHVDGTALRVQFVSDLARLTFSDPAPAPAAPLHCADFLDYTKNEMAKVVNDVKQKETARTQIIATLEDLSKQLDLFVKSGNSSNSVLVGTYAVDEEKVREISLSFKKKDVSFNSSALTVATKETLMSKKIYLRANRTIIAEFSTGIFYTNLKYQKYGVNQVNGEQTVVDAGTEKYPVVEAAHLNLVFNVWDGIAHPALQIGVGTAKDKPSLLFGGGLRFTKPKRLCLTYGRIWTWRKELQELSLGSKVAGQGDLEKDLKYVLQNKSDYYIGIQYNF